MCQRKIITDKNEWTVPLFNGCVCPMVKEFHHINPDVASTGATPRASRFLKKYSLPEGCYDIHTTIPIPNVSDHHVVFRNCDCLHASGQCMNLPPLLYVPTDEQLEEFGECDHDEPEDDDEDDPFRPGGNMGVRPQT